MKLPLAHYAFSSCNLYRTFPSLNEGLPFTTLLSPHPELFQCNATDGLSLDVGVPPPNRRTSPMSFLEGESSLAMLQEQSNTSLGWTFAMWFTPGLGGNSGFDPIFTIGALESPDFFSNPDMASDDDELPWDDDFYDPPPKDGGCGGYDFQIALFKRDVAVSYTQGQDSLYCQSLGTWKASIDGLTHVAFTLTPERLVLSFEDQMPVRAQQVSNGLSLT
jgi:hypothetical protein